MQLFKYIANQPDFLALLQSNWCYEYVSDSVYSSIVVNIIFPIKYIQNLNMDYCIEMHFTDTSKDTCIQMCHL